MPPLLPSAKEECSLLVALIGRPPRDAGSELIAGERIRSFRVDSSDDLRSLNAFVLEEEEEEEEVIGGRSCERFFDDDGNVSKGGPSRGE